MKIERFRNYKITTGLQKFLEFSKLCFNFHLQTTNRFNILKIISFTSRHLSTIGILYSCS